MNRKEKSGQESDNNWFDTNIFDAGSIMTDPKSQPKWNSANTDNNGSTIELEKVLIEKSL